MPNQTTNSPMVMKVLRIIEVTMEQRVRLRVRVPSAMRTEYERSHLSVIVLVLVLSAAVLVLDGCFRLLSCSQSFL